MQKVFFISGLGADERIYSLLDLSFCEPIFLDWITPLKNESLEAYAKRLRDQISEKHPVIVGISFGGMLATEMAKADPLCKAVIISSNKTYKEFPPHLRSGKYFPIYKLMPPFILRKMALGFKYMLGATGEEAKIIIAKMIVDTDMKFLKWAIHAILHWKNMETPSNVVHIHGTKDKILPYRLVKADHTIGDAKHVMTLNEHREISILLKKLITPLSYSETL